MVEIVCYMGGTCGDIVTAMIDSRGAALYNTIVRHQQNRIFLKKATGYNHRDEKDQYVRDISKTYNSVPSHDLEYHLLSRHRFISIVVESFDLAVWAAQRFKNSHPDSDWTEVNDTCGASTVEQYANEILNFSKRSLNFNKRILSLESIIRGDAVEKIEALIDRSLHQTEIDFYHNWLSAQNK